MKKLFVSPHPDDVEIACGGTIARATEVGDEVHLAIMVGEGDLTMMHSAQTITFEQRKREQGFAANTLGVSKVIFLEIGRAAYLDTVPLSKAVSALDELLLNEKYDELYIPYPNFNQDHEYTWKACIAALRPTKQDQLRVFVYEQATQYHGQQFAQVLTSRWYVMIEERHQTLKEKALLCHKSQVHNREDKMLNEIRSLATLRGLEAGVKYAEMYHLMRAVV